MTCETVVEDIEDCENSQVKRKEPPQLLQSPQKKAKVEVNSDEQEEGFLSWLKSKKSSPSK